MVKEHALRQRGLLGLSLTSLLLASVVLATTPRNAEAANRIQKTVVVPANSSPGSNFGGNAWINTGINVAAGDPITINATGSWSPGAPQIGPVGPNGSSVAWPDNFLNLKDLGVCPTCATTKTARWASLVGFIGRIPPYAGSYAFPPATDPLRRSEPTHVFFVGASYRSGAPFSGTLWLNFNDDAYSGASGDNTGQVTATVWVNTSASQHGSIIAMRAECLGPLDEPGEHATVGFYLSGWQTGDQFAVIARNTNTGTVVDRLPLGGPGVGAAFTFAIRPLPFGVPVRFEVSDTSKGVGGVGTQSNLVTCRQAPKVYVALGDSFSAGDGAPAVGTLPGQDSHSNPGAYLSWSCKRSQQAYAYQFTNDFQSLGYQVANFDACTGAHIDNFKDQKFPEQSVWNGQLSHLNASVQLVTLSVGGNDIGFPDIAATCIESGDVSSGCVSLNDQVDIAIGKLVKPDPGHHSLKELYREIHRRAPNARILVIDYPKLLPNSLSGDSTCSNDMRLNNAAIQWLNGKQQLLNATIESSVADSQVAEFVDVWNAFPDHDVCSTDPFHLPFVNPLTFDQELRDCLHPALAWPPVHCDFAEEPFTPLHPTDLGHDVEADLLGRYLTAHPIPVAPGSIDIKSPKVSMDASQIRLSFTVSFTAKAKQGDGFTYYWDFGDGEVLTTTDATTQHLYGPNFGDGVYMPSVVVRDNRGFSAADVTIVRVPGGP